MWPLLDILWLFLYIFPFWYVLPRKIWQPRNFTNLKNKIVNGINTIKLLSGEIVLRAKKGLDLDFFSFSPSDGEKKTKRAKTMNGQELKSKRVDHVDRSNE
jgi:hypothetical protein